MSHPIQTVTTLSTKGQVILPRSIRRNKDWNAGTRLIVEDTPEGVFLRKAPAFAPTAPDAVFSILPWGSGALSIEEMDVAVLNEAGRRYDRD